MQETWVQSLGWEDPLEKEMATHSNILAWKIPWTEEPGRLLPVNGVAESDTTERLHFTSLQTMMLFKCCTQYISNLENNSGHRTERGQFSFQSQRKAMLNNIKIMVKLCSCHMLIMLCSKSFKLGFSSM